VKRSIPFIDLVFIAGSALLFFFTFLGNIHLFDWDEINFAECAREMIVSNDYWHVQIDFKPFHEKPPLFIWFQVLSMKLWGINEYAARFPNALCGFITLLSLYRIAYKHFHRTMALFWVLCYMGSILPHFYFKSGIIDPWFNYFIFLSLYFIYRYLQQKETRWIIVAGILCGLAVFTKGPVAYLLLMLTVVSYQAFIWYKIRSFQKTFAQHILAFLLFSVLSFSFISIWYAIDIWQNGPALFYDFIQYQVRLFSTEDAGHGGFPGYHVVVLLLGCFPASFIAFHAYKHRLSFRYLDSPLAKLLLAMGIVVLLVFSFVQSKIIHYSSLCYYPISFFAAIALVQVLRKRVFLPLFIRRCLLFFFLILSFSLALLPLVPIAPIQNLLQKDPFAQANLDATLIWSPWAIVLSLLYGLFAFGLYRLSFKLKRQRVSFAGYFALCIAFLHLFFWFYLANVERISQHTAIAFFHSLRYKPVYVGVYGYKSYAHLFYANTANDSLFKLDSRENVLLSTPLTKPVYLVAKVPYNNQLDSLGFQQYGSMNGFVFLVKESAIKH
jgi:4-amino-4-deoxy-L-arabinose transferase-like glycosyltransferase